MKLTEDEANKIKNAMSECWAAVEHDCASQYKNQNIPISHAVSVILDLFHPGRLMYKLDPEIYKKFETLSATAKTKLARSIL